MRTSKAAINSISKYNKANTIQICLRLNKKTDADIIAILNDKTSKTGYIKELIRLDYLRDNSVD